MIITAQRLATTMTEFTEFIAALQNPHITFLRYALLAGILASVSFGIMGTFVVVRRISYMAGAISHCVLGGVGFGLYVNKVLDIHWFLPIHGAIISALLAAFVIWLVTLYANQREDTLIGAIWASGMAIGLLFLAKTPGYIDPMSYLFGNILLISKADLYTIATLNILVLVPSIYFYNQLVAVSFDEEYSRLRGIPVEFFQLLLLLLTALTVVVLIRIVGIVMVIALLTLPPAISSHLSHRLWLMMLYSVGLCICFIFSGIGLSFTYDLPSGPVIILIAALAYFFTLVASLILQKFRRDKTITS